MKRFLAFVLFTLLLTAVAYAQTPTFVASSDATAYHYNSAWTVGNHTTESLDLLDWGAAKNSRLFVTGDEFLAPAAGLGVYTAGAQVQPDLSSLVSKTNLTPGSFQLFGAAGLGAGTNAVGGANHLAFHLGGGARYQVTPNLSWSTLQADYLGVGGAKALALSTGIYYAFNPQAGVTARFEARKVAKAKKTLLKAYADGTVTTNVRH